MLLAAFVIGVGYGPTAPAGSDLLMRVTPRHRRATIFSIKQAGVPLGGVAAGLLLPAVAVYYGGVAAALAVATLLALVAAATLGLWKGAMDDAPPSQIRFNVIHMLLAPVRLLALVMHSSQLRLITAAGFSLGIGQGVVMGFFPVFLSDHAGWSVTAAGAAFALLQGLGVGGRVLMGWMSDRLGDPVRALTWLCFVSGGTMVLLATIGPNSSTLLIAVLSALAGLTVISWNGVFLTGLAETAPEGRVGEATSAGTFIVFSGYVLCPLLMQGVVYATGGYATGLILAGLTPALAGAALMLGPRRHDR
jgi:sugar phosphate permease